jgi:Homeodomain-like domain
MHSMTMVQDRYTDPMVALEALAVALEQNAAEERLLASRVRDLASGRGDGMPWLSVLTREPDPGTVQLMSRVLGRLSMASGTFRRSLVLALRDEGVSIPAIARLFGVTHQRVSNLLRGTSESE